MACPPCGNQLRARYAYESRKMTYRDARRWLRPDHYLRNSKFDALFDGQSEGRQRPVPKTPEEQRLALNQYQAWLSRHGKVNQSRVDSGIQAGLSESVHDQGRSRTRTKNAATSTREDRESIHRGASSS